MLDNTPKDLLLNDLVESHAGLEGRELVANIIKAAPGKVALLSSFGAESAVLLHMVSEIDLNLPVLFLDTEKLFPETLAYVEQLTKELGLKDVRHVKPDPEDMARHDLAGDLHQFSKDKCCHYRKTVPMRAAQKEFDILISGRKRYHGASRTSLDFISMQDGKIKIEPLAAFSALDLRAYMQSHHLSSHPLALQGYRSIGCVPCTAVGGSDEDPRAGRWAGTEKTECGIHFSVNGTVIRTEQRQTASI
jgi:phosphoadenosine phosphosulfate reductase